MKIASVMQPPAKFHGMIDVSLVVLRLTTRIENVTTWIMKLVEIARHSCWDSCLYSCLSRSESWAPTSCAACCVQKNGFSYGLADFEEHGTSRPGRACSAFGSTIRMILTKSNRTSRLEICSENVFFMCTSSPSWLLRMMSMSRRWFFLSERTRCQRRIQAQARSKNTKVQQKIVQQGDKVSIATMK